MTDGNFFLVEIFDAQCIAEGAGQFLKFQNLAGVGFFVDAMDAFDGAMQEIMRDGSIGGEHELFNDAVGDVALAARDVGHALLRVELDDRFGEIEIDGAVFVAPGVEEKGETFHGAEMMIEMGVARGHFRIAFEDLVDVGVGHALGGADDALHHPGIEHASSGIEVHDGALHEAFFARLEGAHAVGERFRKHGHGAIDEVDGIAAEAGFAIERRLGKNVVGHIGDVNLQKPTAILAAIDVNGIVEIARGFTVDSDYGKFSKILATCAIGFGDGKSESFGFVKNFLREKVGKVMLANDDFRVDAKIAGAAEDFDDAAGRRSASTGVAQKFDVDDGAIEFRDVRQAATARDRVFCAGKKLLAQSCGEFIAGGEFDLVLHAGIVGEHDATARGVAELADNGGMRSADDADDAAFGAAGAGHATEASNFGDDRVAVHGVFNLVAWDEDVAIDVGKGDLRNDEAVAVLMVDQPAANFVAGNGFVLGKFLGSSGGGRWQQCRVLCGEADNGYEKVPR